MGIDHRYAAWHPVWTKHGFDRDLTRLVVKIQTSLNNWISIISRHITVAHMHDGSKNFPSPHLAPKSAIAKSADDHYYVNQ